MHHPPSMKRHASDSDPDHDTTAVTNLVNTDNMTAPAYPGSLLPRAVSLPATFCKSPQFLSHLSDLSVFEHPYAHIPAIQRRRRGKPWALRFKGRVFGEDEMRGSMTTGHLHRYANTLLARVQYVHDKMKSCGKLVPHSGSIARWSNLSFTHVKAIAAGLQLDSLIMESRLLELKGINECLLLAIDNERTNQQSSG